MKTKNNDFIRHILLPMLFLFAIAAAASCGGGSSGGGNGGGGAEPTAATAVIDSAGGTLTGPDGVQVVVPAGALDQPTEIGIARGAAGAPAALDAYPVAGNVYELTPHDLLFNLPVTIRAHLPSGALGTSVFMASPGEDWNLKNAVVVNGVAEWQRNSFSWLYWSYPDPTLVSLGCSVPASMANDPYWCGLNASLEWIDATPAQALTVFPFPVVNPGVGSYRVDQAATLHLSSALRVVGNCRNVAVRLFRSRFDESTQAWGPRQLLSTQSPALPVVDSQLRGTATFDLPFTYLDNGKNGFELIATFECPGVLRVNGDVVGYDYANYRSHYLWGVTLVVGNIAPPTVFYTVGGSVSGLTGTGLVLQNNGGDNRAVTANGAFTFATSVGAGSPYNVTVFTQPTGQTCTVQNGSGTAQANVSNVAVSCGALALAVSPTNPTAVGCSTETVTFTASGGTAPYTWSTSEGVDGGGPVNLSVVNATQAMWFDTSDNFCASSGTVTITVTDSVGATASAIINVNQG